jgi:two-component system NtrC family sensor kinase
MNQRILVIDDNPAIHADIRKILIKTNASSATMEEAEELLFGEQEIEETTHNFEIDSAYQGQDGLEKVKQALAENRPYALAFVDVRMPPGWDGIETITRIWEHYPELQVVICTAYSDYSWEEMTRKVKKSDSVLILKKPFDNIEVLQMAHALTKKWHLTQEAKSQLSNLDSVVAQRTAELQLANERLTREIAERNQAENQLRQAQKMEAVGHLAAGVAHDFRNILTVIQGHANLRLLNKDLDPKVRSSLKEITAAVERASQLTRQLLAFSRKQIIQLQVVDLNDLISQLSSMLIRLIGEHITLQCQYQPELPCIEADICSIEQVVMNLVVNSRDAMPSGGRLTIRTNSVEIDADYVSRNPEAAPGRYICMTVTDTGCGMDESTKSRLFEPFFTTKEVGKGTGMGLATVYGIVKQHNGWIEVESVLKQGATFRIFLPVSHKALTVSEKKAALPGVYGGKETILIVEDEEPVRRFVSELLQEYGYDVRLAGNGVEALKIWKDHSRDIDLLLTDVVMPESISGLQLADKLLAEKRELKVIYTSGYSLELLEGDFQTRTDVNFVPKPYHPLKLAEAVRTCLDA